MQNSEWIDIVKLDIARAEQCRYAARILRREAASLTVEALFDREDTLRQGLMLQRGDRFVETFFTERWYNIFEIHAREGDGLKGWYCNICRPAELAAHELRYVDLALDLLVFPDGRMVVLDQDEFYQLAIDDSTRAQALDALKQLQHTMGEIVRSAP